MQVRANIGIVPIPSIGIRRIAALHYYVHDLDRTRRFFVEKLSFADPGGGTLAMFQITTPFGDTTFRFVERRGYQHLFPGFVPAPAPAAGATGPGNRFGFQRIDHLTSNFQTMKPALLWMQHVLGFEPFW